MQQVRWGRIAAALSVGGVLFAGAGAQPLLAAEPGPAAAAAAPVYLPSMADLMTMAVQPRHAKLGLAGAARNWPYLAYEVRELRGAFTRIARTVPTFRTLSTADLIAATISEPLDTAEAAIKAKDAKAFDAAYAQVTDACNACHQSQSLGHIVITAPKASAFANQDFRPVPER